MQLTLSMLAISRYVRSIAVLAAGQLCCDPQLAYAQWQSLRQMDHAMWTARDGAPQAIRVLAQDRDGTLWIGGEGGLVNFDGQTFRLFQSPPGEPQLPAVPVQSLLIAKDGTLWVGFFQAGVARIKAGRVTVYSFAEQQQLGLVEPLREAEDGSIWAVANQLYLIRFGRDETWHLEAKPLTTRIGGLFIDRSNTLWLVQGGFLYKRSLPHETYVKTDVQGAVVFGFLQMPDGLIWMADVDTAADRGRVQLIDAQGSLAGVLPVKANPSGLALAPDGSLVMSLQSEGVRRFTPDEWSRKVQGDVAIDPDIFTSAHGLSSSATWAALVDTHGNIWIGGERGLDRLRPARLTPFEPPGSQGKWSVCAAKQGGLWLGSSLGVLHYVSGAATATLRDVGDLYALTCLDGGRAWYVDYRGIHAVEAGRIAAVPGIPGVPPYGVITITVASDQTLYASVGGSRTGVGGIWRFRDRQWSKLAAEGVLGAAGFVLHTDAQDRLWKGYAQGVLMLHSEDGVQRFESDSPGSGYVFAILETERGLFAAGNGLAVLRHTRLDTLAFAEPAVARGVRGLVESRDGDLWLNAAGGIVRVPAGELAAALTTPSYRMKAELINEGEFAGAGQSLTASLQTAARDAGGRLWFSTRRGLVSLDPQRDAVANRPPIVTIRSIAADRRPVGEDGRLGTRPRVVEVQYLGVNLTAPEKVTYRYRLEGFDESWQEAESRTEAVYTRLPPGTYRFSVIASNGDGRWTMPVESTLLTVLPAFYQTWWFTAALLATGLLSVFAVYRIRVQQISRVMAARFDERLAERTRVARELHDTLLQTVHGSKLVADRALRDTADRDRLVAALGQVSVWLGQAAEEGRAALQSLRASITERNDLTAAFRRAIEECRNDSGVEVSFSVQGSARDMHPVVRDEVYRIGYEAIRNACVHSRASRLDVTLEYGDDLTLRIGDNGVGIDAAVIETGREGHFGIRGMRERAARIGAKFALVSSPGTGTSITLSVPGRIAFQSARRDHRPEITTTAGSQTSTDGP